MFQERKEYRKHLNASGQLYIGGEILNIVCHDVSVKGLMVEVAAGELMSTCADFEAWLNEDNQAEIFVPSLMLAGQVEAAWVKHEESRILIGLEFHNVVHNAQKLWRKRHGFRKRQLFEIDMVIDKQRIKAKGINRSTEGMCLSIDNPHPALRLNAPVKVFADLLAISAIGKIIWIQEHATSCVLGLKVLNVK